MGNSYYSERIYYNSPTGTATPQYNGNISQFSYNGYYMNQVNSLPLTNFNTVNYTYDNLSRLTRSQSTIGKNDERVVYDVMGNIDTLIRTGTSWLSGALAYTYNSTSNQLHTVKINGGATNYKTYSYNGNGAATGDSTNRTLSYNLYNMPLALTKSGTTLATYYYDGNNNKLRDVSTTAGTRDYINGIVYVNGQISFIQTEEGRVTLASDSITYSYSYDLKDYLGNVRASYDNTGAGATFAIRQENDYYPFGLSQPYYDNLNGNRYLYNGKEQQFDLANQYDYGARFYDSSVGRWTVVDPLAEDYFSLSQYCYTSNNPVRYIDPTGMRFKDPFDIEKDYQKDVTKNKTAVDDALEHMDLSDDKKSALQKLSKGMQDILDELSTLDKSDVTYNVGYNDNTGVNPEDAVEYNFQTNEVTISVSRNPDFGVEGHEFKHAFQYDKGEVSFRSDGLQPTLTDITDETAGYNRERLLNGGPEYFNGASPPYTDDDTRAHGRTMPRPAYQTLPAGPIDINSPQGRALRQSTIDAGRAGKQVTEVYHGWQKDYAKGAKQK